MAKLIYGDRLAGYGQGGAPREAPRVPGMCYTLIWAVMTWLDTFKKFTELTRKTCILLYGNYISFLKKNEKKKELILEK